MAKASSPTFVPAIHPSVPWETRQHIQLLYQKLQNLNTAIGIVNTKTGTATTTNIINVAEGSGGGGGGGTTETIGMVNDQTGNTTYATVTGDYGAFVILNSASPIAVTLNGSTPPWFVFFFNQGKGTATLTPNTTTGPSTISYNGNLGAASMPLLSQYGAIVAYDGVNWWAEAISTFSATSALGITIDGGLITPLTGPKGYLNVPYACTITSWVLLADQSGSAQITVKKCAFAAFPTTVSIVASAPPALVVAQKNSNSVLAGWTTAISAGDILEFNLDSVTACIRLTLQLVITRS